MFARSILRSARPQVLMATRSISRSVVLNKGAMDSLREKASDAASKVSDAASKASDAASSATSNVDVSNMSSTSDMPPELAELTDAHAGEKVDKVLRAQGKDLGKHEGDKASDGNGHVVPGAYE